MNSRTLETPLFELKITFGGSILETWVGDALSMTKMIELATEQLVNKIEAIKNTHTTNN